MYLLASQNTIARETKREKQTYSDALRVLILIIDQAYLSDALKDPKKHVTLQNTLTSILKRTSTKLDSPSKIDNIQHKVQSLKSSKDLISLKEMILQAYTRTNILPQIPNYLTGKQLYHTYCESCHGSKAQDNTKHLKLAQRFQTPPLSFDSPQAKRLSAHHIFNLLLTGLPSGTMTSFEETLSTNQLWSLSFYTLSLSYHCTTHTPQTNTTTAAINTLLHLRESSPHSKHNSLQNFLCSYKTTLP
ncbi:MAG: cytochrome c [Proteobacteria bacterium]|nr:cytochrome c [Pseudomonadota bacterium]